MTGSLIIDISSNALIRITILIELTLQRAKRQSTKRNSGKFGIQIARFDYRFIEERAIIARHTIVSYISISVTFLLISELIGARREERK
jgi:hypothetical protein